MHQGCPPMPSELQNRIPQGLRPAFILPGLRPKNPGPTARKTFQRAMRACPFKAGLCAACAPCALLPSSFGDVDDAVDAGDGGFLDLAIGPVDLDAIDGRGLAEAEVEAGVTRR